MLDEKFSWVETHKQLTKYLKTKENEQGELIEVLKSAGIKPFSDKEAEGNHTIELKEIDPFTFFCYIYKYGSERRLKNLKRIAKKLNLTVPVGESGIPSAQAQKVWLFPYQYLRKNNEISRLWSFFFKSISDSITDEDFQDVLSIRGTGKVKLTEALFYINPEKYLPINGPTVPYIENVLGLNPKFTTYKEYVDILNSIKSKTERPFYELSYDAWKWNKEQNKINYWVFQGNPKVYDFETALSEDAITSWTVTAHKEKIKKGDKAIIWITGKEAGCYALAEIMSAPYVKTDSPDNHYWKGEDTNTLKVDINITDNFIDDPVLALDIVGIEALENLKVGNQGTNFSSTKEEYDGIVQLSEDEGSFHQTKTKFEPEVFDIYMAALRKVISHLNVKPGDPRIVFSVRKHRLNLIVGQRYCLNIHTSSKRGTFGFISKDQLIESSKQFSGKSPQPFYNYANTFNPSEDEWQNIMSAISDELSRTTKSSFAKYNNMVFENYVFMNEETTSDMTMNHPLNQILYGPPGTGKTYTLKTKYFDRYITKETALTKEEYFEEVVRGLTWWQVVALALLEKNNQKVSDLVENHWVAHKSKISESKNVRATLWGTLQMHTIQESETVAYTQRLAPLIFDKNKDKSWQIMEDDVKEQTPELIDILEDYQNFKPNPDNIIQRYVFTTFHQSFSYEDFIEGIKPVISEIESGNTVQYKIEDGVFKELCRRAASDPNNRYAIFIDEINRGNVSAIFGELITLIETDKRKGAENALSATLPYSKSLFTVPSNVDIYGTMNTADRSVEALDTALRRRFSFVEMMPNPSLLKQNADHQGIIEGIDLADVLQTINDRIEVLVDRDHTIGHSYFLKVNNSADLKNAFKDKIIPLLQEYFFGDYGKMEMVIGAYFFEEKKDKVSFAVQQHNYYDLPKRYLLKDLSSEDFDIIQAMRGLLGISTAQ